MEYKTYNNLTMDITDKIKIEETNAFLASIVESSDDAIIGKSTDYKIISWNKGAEKIYGYKAKEVLGEPITMLVPQNKIEETNEIRKKLLEGIKINQYNTERVKKDGTKIHISLTVSPIKDSQGNIIGASAIERDISEKIISQQRLETSLKEKELLLKEIHHRVKNNLQIISSLLSIQSQYIKDENSLAKFRESQNHLRTMALVHEKLYQSGDLLKISFPEYVEDLVASLIDAYSIKKSSVKVILNINHINVSIDEASTLGLILNELITNSFKHVFKNSSNNELEICFYKNNENEKVLIVKDNGKGFPSDFDLKNVRSFGLNLITALTEQLGGNIEYSNNYGSSFIIKFKDTTGL